MAPNCVLLLAIAAACGAARAEVVRRDFDPSVFTARPRASDGFAASPRRAIAPCTETGPACDPACRKTGICMQGSNGVLSFRETADCGDLYCKPKAGPNGSAVCADDPGDCVPNSDEIGCDGDGVFPDMYDCRSVLQCKDGAIGESTSVCTNNNVGYDICTGHCNIALTNLTCYQRPAMCKYYGQIERVPYNDRLYYYCIQDSEGLLHPVLGRCSRGYFDKESVSCSQSDVPGCIAP